MDLTQLTAHILEFGQPALATEQSAGEAIAAFRWPQGVECPRCYAPCVVREARIHCAGGHEHSIFHGSALGRKRRISARGMLIALREMASSWRSISARELARNLQINHVSLWRHMHALRLLLLHPPALTTSIASGTQVCGRKTRVKKAFVLAGTGMVGRASRDKPIARHDFNQVRIAAESVRTWLAGTFRGVSARWLHRYLAEHTARARKDPRAVVLFALLQLRMDPRLLSDY